MSKAICFSSLSPVTARRSAAFLVLTSVLLALSLGAGQAEPPGGWGNKGGKGDNDPESWPVDLAVTQLTRSGSTVQVTVRNNSTKKKSTATTLSVKVQKKNGKGQFQQVFVKSVPVQALNAKQGAVFAVDTAMDLVNTKVIAHMQPVTGEVEKSNNTLIKDFLPPPPPAPVTTPLRVLCTQFTCNQTSDGWGDDEPYLLVFVADLSTFKSDIFLSKVWKGDDSVGQGVTKAVNTMVWGLNGQPAAITDPDNFIILVALMEYDGVSSTPNSIKEALGGLSGKAFLYKNNGYDRALIVSKLMASMRDIITGTSLDAIPIIPSDDILGIQELRLTKGDVEAARAGGVVGKSLSFTEGGANYSVSFSIQK